MAGDSLLPVDIVEKMAAAGKAKAEYPALQLVIRGMGAGALLAVATALSVNAWVMDMPKIVGDFIFPVGFVILMLTGTELLTGNMALLPLAVLRGKIRIIQIPRAWALVLLGNFLGSVLYGAFFYAINSDAGTYNCDDAAVSASAKKICDVAYKKTGAYSEMEYGRGWALAFVRAIACNWLVCYGTVLNFASEATIGRIAAMWLPIFTFFSLGYEHLIVNLFVIPTAMMLNAKKVTFSNWILWNFFPVALGNLIGGLTIAVHHWYMHTPAKSAAKVPNGTAAPSKDGNLSSTNDLPLDESAVYVEGLPN